MKFYKAITVTLAFKEVRHGRLFTKRNRRKITPSETKLLRAVKHSAFEDAITNANKPRTEHFQF